MEKTYPYFGRWLWLVCQQGWQDEWSPQQNQLPLVADLESPNPSRKYLKQSGFWDKIKAGPEDVIIVHETRASLTLSMDRYYVLASVSAFSTYRWFDSYLSS